MEFADLFSLHHGKIDYGLSLRYRDVEVCLFGALALCLFSSFHFETEEFSNFKKRESWHMTMVFKDDSPFIIIQYKAQHSTYIKDFKKIGVRTSKMTHANRKSALNLIAQENDSSDQQRMVGSLVGFSGQQNTNYFLPRAVTKSSLALQRLEDMSGPNFLNLLAHLLQDSVVLKKKNFEVQVLGSFEEVFLSNRRAQLAIPKLVSTLQSGSGAITSSLLSMKAVNTAEFKRINQSFGYLFALGNAHFNSSQILERRFLQF
ncbi:hypothetical protein G6F16_007584 [Rhizopus arrhizus]|nr:hypothetical protein G6F24_006087 [Rhizopus arrhizus]KAG0788617.1 hypothetical protein G6F21_007086 [Rhizopus arrhizus]KAG0799648.1 hypothetical protein G6F22_003016 [Rhizopus arrhizus]KAG0811843.1 hypothetical protein G6F20_006845 [Rhizopus arrhizus]KAG0831967.1 hypothetical protein G6F18_007415 [Rhizopus arrhizus]